MTTSDERLKELKARLEKKHSLPKQKVGHYDIGGVDMFFRSKWEANYALYLNWLKKVSHIKGWEFEPEKFVFDKIQFGTRSYLPDFKVFNNDGTVEYHEVKGYMDPKSATKLKRMTKYFPEVKIVLIDKKPYYAIMRMFGKMLGFY